MKKLTLKSIITTALFALMLFAFVFSGITLTRSYAGEQKTTGFTMEGAQARISEPYGLRFKAKLGQKEYESLDFENGDYLGMLIVPQLYLEHFAEDLKGENPDYVTVLESKNVFLANVKNITPYVDGDYWAFNGVLGNVKYDNLNVDFVGIGYYNLDGEYFYADQITRNFGEVISTTVAKGVADATAAKKASELNALAFAQKIGKTEDQAKEFAKEDLAGKLTGNQVANFDDESYLDLLTNEENFNGWTSKFEDDELYIVDIDDRKALELRATNYRALTINFVKPFIVTENTVVNLTIKTPLESRILVNTDSLSGPSLPNAWSTASYLATDLGYNVGDVMSKISLSLHNQKEWYYIDEITVTEKVDLAKLLTGVSDLGYGEVANYNHTDYTLLDFGEGNGASITEDGKLAITVTWSDGYSKKTHIPFAREITVREGDKLVVNMSGNNICVDKKDGTNLLSKTSYYGYDQTISLANLGYSVGDKVSYLTLSGDGLVAKINYIKVVNDNEEQIKLVESLQDYQIANFDDAAYQKLISSGTVSNGNLVTNKKETITVTLPQPKTFTVNDYLVFNVKETGWMQVNGQYVTGPSDLPAGDFNWYNEAVRCNGFFIRVTEGYHLVILPVAVAKCEVGVPVSSLTIYNNTDGDELALDWIECVTLSSNSLTLKDALKEYYELKLSLTPNQVYPNATSASVDFADKNAMALVQANPYVGKQNYTVTYVEDEQAVKIVSSETGYIASNVRLYFAKPITLTASTKVKLTVKVEMDASRGWDFEFKAFDNSYKYTNLANNVVGEYLTITLQTDARNETWNLFNSSMHGKELSYLDLWFGEEFDCISIKSITVIE